ncbi:MAG: HAMP domain-containing protein [Elusimicrobia bacterium]|nr:HAMP domain-containing protein [Elusimicrobiota bacterium]
MKIKLLYKFIIVLVGISVIPLIVVGIKMISINREALRENILNNHITNARYLAEDIDNFIGALREKLLFLISSQSIQALDFRGKQTIIQSLLSSTEYFVAVSMVNSSGEEFVKAYNAEYADESEIRNLSGTGLFEKARSQPAISEVYGKNGEARLDVIYPVSAKEYIFITVTLKKLWDKIRNADIGEMGAVFLVDGRGKILAHPDKDMEGKTPGIPTIEAVLTRASMGSMEYVYGGRKMVGSYAPVESMGWGIVTEQPYEHAYVSVIRMKKDAYRWIAILMVIALMAAYALARGLSGPILKLIRGASAVAGGDFEHSVNINTKDELQMLSATFNDMVASLRKYNEMQIDKIIAERTKTEAIVYSIEDGIVMTDYEGRIMLVNSRAKELLEMKTEPRESEHISGYISNERLREMFSGDKEAEVDLTKGEQKKIIKLYPEQVNTKSGKNLGRMTVIRDITLEKEIEEVKESFLHSITHDLKNPLSAIMGLTDLLKKGRKDVITETEEKYFKVIKDEALRLMGMLNDILNLARLESGNLVLDKKEFDISSMIDEVRDTFWASANADGIDLVTPGSGVPVKITADEGLIKRVIINLVGNALKHTHRGGRITMAAREHEGELEAEVTDTGVGIPEGMTKKIFDKFQQVGGQSKGGTGIGLNIAKEVVEAHGGRIWVISELGKGSSFRFRIPCK